MTALMWLALLTLVGSTVPDAGVLSENEPPLHEVEVRRVDGGFALELDAGHADGGEAQPQLLPPALLTDSPAAYPEELRSERAFGEVKLQLLVDEAGEVAEVLL
ncbi:MAG: energy transducer TonB, partial [Myxococcota bacterium]